MNDQSIRPHSLRASLNFAADRSDGGEFSGLEPERIRQNLVPQDVTITNARALLRPPTLETEGFTLVTHAISHADWSNQAWIDAEYVPSCLDLVKQLTGAKTAVALFGTAVQRRVDFDPSRGIAGTAHFAHLDFPRNVYREQAVTFAAAQGLTFKRATAFNVWKATTPPPQDVPLAIANWRTVPESDHVLGNTVQHEFTTPYVILAPSLAPVKWNYFPDMTGDESVVFVGGDFDPSHPLGCPHTAFVHPDPAMHGAPRGSIELRVLACFE